MVWVWAVNSVGHEAGCVVMRLVAVNAVWLVVVRLLLFDHQGMIVHTSQTYGWWPFPDFQGTFLLSGVVLYCLPWEVEWRAAAVSLHSGKGALCSASVHPLPGHGQM